MTCPRPAVLTVLLTTLILTGCGGERGSSADAARTVEPGAEFTLAPGESARPADGSLTVTFDKITEDSRCPKNVTCVWEGDAIAELTIATPTGRAVHRLHTNARFATSADVGGHRVQLVKVTPERLTADPIAPGAYRAVLTIRKA
ncbi:hypothetical protein [Rhizohabitans arisaemae]|uniref:hypothetical protein n=1 Tax=Rhizohabitans arisaemae TaxID=2720610 RepID=UPI0024B08A87|nr:hypothetical protein [Rhizohabitans arisaemae]